MIALDVVVCICTIILTIIAIVELVRTDNRKSEPSVNSSWLTSDLRTLSSVAVLYQPVATVRVSTSLF